MKKKSHKKSSGRAKAKIKENIIAYLRTQGRKTFNFKQISTQLGIKDQETRMLVVSALNELAKEEVLIEVARGKFKFNPENQEVVKGRIEFIKSGAAYVLAESGDGDIYIPANKTERALHGDIVAVALTRYTPGHREGQVVEVLERSHDQYAGTLDISEKFAFFIPSNTKIHLDFFVDLKDLNGAKPGEKVIARIKDWPDSAKSPFAEVVTVLGKSGLNEVEMHAILVEFGLPFEFPEAVLNAASKIDTEISEAEIKKRRDFREVNTFTIDPADAKDFDDALSIRRLENGNLEIGVHIADVSHYVQPNSILDKEATNRATSVYLVDRVVPMLPEVLSNEVCSLRPEEDKLCFSAVFELDEEANLKQEWFGRTVINSNRRFTYEEAQERIETGKGDWQEEINTLNNLAKIMRARRVKQGALEFGGEEVKFHLDEEGKPVGVYKKVIKDSNRLIEEFMLLANKKVAEFIGKPAKDPEKRKPKTFVYRVHDFPDPEKLKILKDFVGRLGYRLTSIKPEKASAAINQLIRQVEGKQEEDVVKQMSIRAMAKAFYTTENIGHYGLAFDYYTHFTSPIRRYPDVMAHRLLQRYLDGGSSADAETIERLCKHSSIMEKKAADAERASIKYKQVEFMMDKIGSHFEGVISGLTKWGMYVELVDNKCEGMVPLNSIQDDNYHFNEEKFQIIGSRHKKVFEFGDKVVVEVYGADLVLKQLDFRLVSE